MEIAFFWILFSALVGMYASNKGNPGFWYFLFSLILSPLIGFILALISVDNREKKALANKAVKKCPLCAELIKIDAVKCKHCKSDLQTVAQ